MAVLKFLSLGISNDGNLLQINGTPLAGGISAGPQFIGITPKIPLWNAHSLLVDANVLNEENVLRVEATTDYFRNYDDFIIDNIVIFFKTRISTGPAGGPIVEPSVIARA
jgi:hypothetical protein